uniref:SH2 domain-containing protein n=1 Tax=Leptobrachium leishanense TaxID=445787 RepID=A0A8C5LTU3_9ANUR
SMRWCRSPQKNSQYDGSFLVRGDGNKASNEPYVLSVYYGGKVYNIKIRYLEDTQQYSLGSGLRRSDKFNSVKDMVEFHKNSPIILVDGREQKYTRGPYCYLTHPPNLHRQKASLSL